MNKPTSQLYTDLNDEACNICRQGGEVVCCDGCPLVFHQSCLGIKELPSGNWYCFNCSCKFCGSFEELPPNFGCLLLACHSCRRKYHVNCVEANNDVNDHFDREFVCGKTCQKIFDGLEVLIGEKHDIGDEFTCTFISKCHNNATKMKPRTLNSKLNVALSIMEECFDPTFINYRGRKIDIIPNIIHSRWLNSPALDYRGFFTVLLEKGTKTISVATIRIHGDHLAEMPFIATRQKYQRKGMCRRLFNAIESALSYLNVEKLVIPSSQYVSQTWISCFGFQPLDTTTQNLIKKKNMVQFVEVQMLEKRIQRKQNISALNIQNDEEVTEEEKLVNETLNDNIEAPVIANNNGESSSHNNT